MISDTAARLEVRILLSVFRKGTARKMNASVNHSPTPRGNSACDIRPTDKKSKTPAAATAIEITTGEMVGVGGVTDGSGVTCYPPR